VAPTTMPPVGATVLGRPSRLIPNQRQCSRWLGVNGRLYKNATRPPDGGQIGATVLGRPFRLVHKGKRNFSTTDSHH
ncbi:MAG: hypothetical protein FWG68_05995, partial [Defluviitaleaceae bacterium]|nr:hypothetical protein [Defluviitaleaceae bacterium]